MPNDSTSDADDDIVVMQSCATKGCVNIDGIQFDIETNESYCGECRERFQRAEREGFHVLLGLDDLALVRLIFDAFDPHSREAWTFNEWCDFASLTDHGTDAEIHSPADLTAFFAEEYDIHLTNDVVTLRDLENMYGGYQYNQVDALTEDCEALEAAGKISSAVLE